MFRAALLLLLLAPCAHSEDYRFIYSFTPRTGFFEMGHSRQTSAGKLVSEFHELVHFQVSQEPDASSPTLTARIVSLSNKGRPIEYYAGVTFQARISAAGEISGHTFYGGQPQHRVDEVGPTARPRRSVEPGRARDQNVGTDLPRGSLPVQLGTAVGAERRHRIILDVGILLAAVVDVVGGHHEQPSARCGPLRRRGESRPR